MEACYLDIETLPTDDPAQIADIGNGITPPRTMSKPETIAKWEELEKPALVSEAVRRTALDGSYGRILAIGYAFGSSAPQCFMWPKRAELPELRAQYEADVIRGFCIALSDWLSVRGEGGRGELERQVTFVGHNVSGFDLRFIWQRCVVLGIKPPPALRRAAAAKPWSDSIADTMILWNPERDRRISMERLCRALGIESPKEDMNGASVFDAYERGDLESIKRYCETEIRALRSVHRRMFFLDAAA